MIATTDAFNFDGPFPYVSVFGSGADNTKSFLSIYRFLSDPTLKDFAG